MGVTALLPGFVEEWVEPAVRDQMMPPDDLAEAVRFLVRTSGRRFVPEITMTTAGPGIWHSPIDWDAATT